MLALNFARQQYGLRLSEEYTVVSCCPKSSQSDLHQRLGYQQSPNGPRQPDTGRAGSPVRLWAAKSTYNEPFSSSTLRCFLFHLFNTAPVNARCSFLQSAKPRPPCCSRSLCNQRAKMRTWRLKWFAGPPRTKVRVWSRSFPPRTRSLRSRSTNWRWKLMKPGPPATWSWRWSCQRCVPCQTASWEYPRLVVRSLL